MCKKGNFLRDVHYSTTPSIGVRVSFLKIDIKDKNGVEWKLVDLSSNPLIPKLSKTLVLLGKFDRYFKDRYPNCTISMKLLLFLPQRVERTHYGTFFLENGKGIKWTFVKISGQEVCYYLFSTYPFCIFQDY